MIGLKKHDMKTILKAGAKARGLSVSEFRAEIQGNIDNIVNSQDPAVQERFKKYFGGRKIFCVYGKNSSLIRNRYV